MSLLLPHKPLIQRHSRVPYLWRVTCPVCSWGAFAPSHDAALAAATSHIESEEPFPDLILPETRHD